MALTSVAQLTQAQYRALNITPLQTPPKVTEDGDPDPDVTITLGGWVGNNVMAFTINNTDETGVTVTPDPDPKSTTLTVTVSDDPFADGAITYWTVNCGTDGSNAEWTLTYAVNGKGTSGKWVFVKGKVGDDTYV